LVFPEIAVGDQNEITINVTNTSEELPISFHIQKIAHFKATPFQAKLQPLQSVDVIFSFAPKQVCTNEI
jgi:hypothetical protein